MFELPELPEVEIVMRGLEPVLTGKRIARTLVNRRDLRVPIPDELESVLDGALVERMQRRGKYILIFMRDRAVVLHLGMSGRILIYGPNDSYKPAKHDHVVLDMADGSCVVFNDPRRFGMFYLVDAESWEQEKPFFAMGAEPLGNGFSGPVLREKLAGRKISIKAALLDQHVVAGVGNIYACEALYDAKIDPQRASYTISDDEAVRLCKCVRDVLARAIEAGGSTLKDYQHTDGSLGYFQHSFSVYDQENKACPDCDCTHGIKRIVQSGRSTFYCPVKQV